jgi:carbon starvation protein CstA
MSFFGGIDLLNNEMAASGGNAALVVNQVSNSLLGKLGGILALLGVVAAPITSGDTAFRSARLIIADLFKFKQGPILNRLIVSMPLFIIAFLLLNLDFSIIWRYFAWTNQTLATIVLWTITAYLIREDKFYWIALIPAVFMTAVVSTYILMAPEGFEISKNISLWIGALLALFSFLFTLWYAKRIKSKEIAYA